MDNKQDKISRRDFITATTASAAALSLGAKVAMAGEKLTNTAKFTMKFAPHFGMFKNHAGTDLIDQIKFIADAGFTAFEDNGMKDRPLEMQEKIAREMARQEIAMGIFVAHKIYWKEPNLASGDADKRAEFLAHIRESVEVAKRVNAKWMTVVPGFGDLRKSNGFQTANIIESLKRASEILEPHGLVMVLEPLNFRDHPGLFLTGVPQAFEICKAVDSPACKVLNDLYHQQIQLGNLIPNIDHAWDEIAYYQIGDNPGRKEPTTGEINYKNVFQHIHNKGFRGILGMEHGNSLKGKAGERAVIAAYRACDAS